MYRLYEPVVYRIKNLPSLMKEFFQRKENRKSTISLLKSVIGMNEVKIYKHYVMYDASNMRLYSHSHGISEMHSKNLTELFQKVEEFNHKLGTNFIPCLNINNVLYKEIPSGDEYTDIVEEVEELFNVNRERTKDVVWLDVPFENKFYIISEDRDNGLFYRYLLDHKKGVEANLSMESQFEFYALCNNNDYNFAIILMMLSNRYVSYYKSVDFLRTHFERFGNREIIFNLPYTIRLEPVFKANLKALVKYHRE